MSAEDRARGLRDAEIARADLYDTLGQLKVQLNYARRIDEATDRFAERIDDVRQTKPAAFAAGVVAIAATAGVVVWAVAQGIAKKFR